MILVDSDGEGGEARSFRAESITTVTAAVRTGLNQVCFLMQHTMRRNIWARKILFLVFFFGVVGAVDLGQEPRYRYSPLSTHLEGSGDHSGRSQAVRRGNADAELLCRPGEGAYV